MLGLGSLAFAQEAAPTGPTPLASGLQLSLKLEPGLAAALSKPQTNRTELGMGHTIQLLFGLNRYLAIGPSFAYTMLPADGVMMEAGKAWTFGAGGRLMRPHDSVGYYGISPWIDGHAMYVRTGDLDRPGFAIGTGVSMPLDKSRRYWLGPFARYSQIVQGNREGFDNRDAKILTFGLGLEITTGLQRNRVRVAAPVEPAVVEPTIAPPSDRDQDGVLDTDDNCPDVAGLRENAGCPPYQAVVVKREKLEVKEKIAFLWNSAKLEASSYPALDEVARVLQDNKSFKVQIDGHSSSDGDDAHNVTLSDQRANAVLDYLVQKGVAKERLTSKGLGSSVPTQTNTTVTGRESNRRVEFVVSFIIVNEGNTP